jgi:hypothetical protein
VLISLLGLLAACTDAPFDAQCAEDASLWIPSDTSVEKTVVKWRAPIKYHIAYRENAEPESSIEETLRLLAQQSGLPVEPAQPADVEILVAPDISAIAPSIRKEVEDFLQQLFLSGTYQGKRHLDIDPAKWDAKFQSLALKCTGVDVVINGAIMRAFNFIQSHQSPACFRVGLGETFGFVNIRHYYLEQAGNLPSELVARATHTLYDSRVAAGASAAQAQKIVREICK